MARTALFAVIAGAVLVVAALAAITPTVLVGDHHERGVRVMRLAGPPRVRGAPALPGRLRLQQCLQRHGVRPGETFPRGTFRECLPKTGPALPGFSG